MLGLLQVPHIGPATVLKLLPLIRRGGSVRLVREELASIPEMRRDKRDLVAQALEPDQSPAGKRR